VFLSSDLTSTGKASGFWVSQMIKLRFGMTQEWNEGYVTVECVKYRKPEPKRM